MRLEAHPGIDSSLNALGRPALELLRAAADRVTFQRDLQHGRSRVWRSGGDDQSGILSETIRLLCEGSDADGKPIATHSVRSLLATSLNRRHSVYVAVDSLGRPEPTDKAEAAALLPSVGLEALHATDLNPLIERSPVLEGRTLVDLSFEIPVNARSRSDLALQVIALIARFGLPIAHLHLPSSPLEGTRFRIGVGVEPLGTRMQLDLFARCCGLANSFRCGLEVASELISGWKVLVTDDQRSTGRRVIPDGWQMQVIAEARVGLVASIFKAFDDSGFPVDHAAMTIIEGCTVVTFGGTDDAAESSLKRVLAGLEADAAGSRDGRGIKLLNSEILRPSNRGDAGGLSTGSTSPVWIGWRCDNVPGGLSQLLQHLEGPLGPSYNITYVASRMVRGGRFNAGKIRAVPTTDLTVGDRREEMRGWNRQGLPSDLHIDLRGDEQDLTHKSEPIKLR